MRCTFKVLAVACALALAGPAAAQQKVKIGFITTPGAERRDRRAHEAPVELAPDHLGRKMAA
jgi:hypothetical protein